MLCTCLIKFLARPKKIEKKTTLKYISKESLFYESLYEREREGAWQLKRRIVLQKGNLIGSNFFPELQSGFETKTLNFTF